MSCYFWRLVDIEDPHVSVRNAVLEIDVFGDSLDLQPGGNRCNGVPY